MQAAVKIVIEPIFEADFQPCSYGFRPKRDAHQANEAVAKYVTYGCAQVIDADLRRTLTAYRTFDCWRYPALWATVIDHRLAELDEQAGRQKRGPDGPLG